MTTSKTRQPHFSSFLLPVIAASFLLAACQEDSRESGYSATEARELRWTAPLTREDGSSLKPGEIAEFRVYYRLRHQEDFKVIRIDNPSTTRLSLEQMAQGAYEFAITTVDNEGLESRRSAPVTVDLI
jgi:fibronectin type 3 domain-containing protein